MFDLLFPSRKELEALMRRLSENPLLAALMMISPLEVFKLLNIMPQFFSGFLPTAGEDAPLADALIQALRAGRTTLDQPQVIITPPPEPAEPPAPEPAGTAAPPALTLTIAKPALQQALQLYAQSNFTGKTFVFPAQSWMDVTTRGQSIALELEDRRARIVARLQGTMALKLGGMQLGLGPQNASFPIEVNVFAALKVDAQNRLFVHVSDGAVSIGRTPLPARLANDLVARLTETLGSIPIVQLPTRFEIPGDPPADLALQLRRIGIDAAGLALEFDL
ncbi:hypothetical protein [Kouleothrix sp.]|uniref:hypothetical protein n=1 Tax=Kouleothrix sp. TaxID=2779161 RepID=UPI003919645E